MKKKYFKKQLKSLQNVTKIQCEDGTWNYDEYMRGMANGLILAESIFSKEEPIFFDPPVYEWQWYRLDGQQYILSGHFHTENEVGEGWLKFEPSKRVRK